MPSRVARFEFDDTATDGAIRYIAEGRGAVVTTDALVLFGAGGPARIGKARGRAEGLFAEFQRGRPNVRTFDMTPLPRLLLDYINTPDEVNVIVGLVADQLKRGEPFEEAVKAGLVATLCSPSFLYLFEPVGPGPLSTDRRPQTGVRAPVPGLKSEV